MIIIILVLGSWSCSSLAAEVLSQSASSEGQSKAASTTDLASSEPRGRGQLAPPQETVLPDVDLEVLHDPSWLGPTQLLPSPVEGTWEWTNEGKRVWRSRIRSPGVRALRLRFENFVIQGSVWLYDDEWNGPYLGPYSGAGPHDTGSFWSQFVFSESVTVEYVPTNPISAGDSVPFRIHSVAQIMDKKFPVPGSRGKKQGLLPRSDIAGCHLDVSCYPSLQTRNQPSVARLYITTEEGTGSCTGFLINPRYDSDSYLLMLTAGHCISTQEQAQSVSFLWNYQTEICYGNPDWIQWAEPLDYTYGATLLVSKDDDDDDFALLRLSQSDVTEVTGWTSLGWTTSPVRSGEQVYTVGHPDGSLKRAAFGESINSRWNSDSWQIVQWRLGTTEPGSSGSPVLGGEGEDWRVVGIHYGSTKPDGSEESIWGPYCHPDHRARFNRFSHVWETIKPYMESASELLTADTPPGSLVVPLGSSGDTVTLVQADNGSWRLGGALVRSGETNVRAENGNIYTLTFTQDGRWTATYSPMEVTVRLGTSGYIVTLVKAEDGSYWRGNREVQSGSSRISTPNGLTYRLDLVNGQWTAVRVDNSSSVM